MRRYVWRRHACALVLSALLLHLLAGCAPAAPTGLQDPAYTVLDLEATARVITQQALQTRQQSIEATRTAAEELARRSQAAQAEIDLINRRAEAEATSLAGQATSWAIVQAQAAATAAPRQTAYALALTEPARAATIQAIGSQAAQARERAGLAAGWAAFAVWALKTLVIILLAGLAGLFLVCAWGLHHWTSWRLIKADRDSAIVERGGAVFGYGLDGRIIVLAMRPGLQPPRAHPILVNGRYYIDRDTGRPLIPSDPEEAPGVAAPASPTAPSAFDFSPSTSSRREIPADPWERARALVEDAITVAGENVDVLPGWRSLPGWESETWQAAKRYLDRWLTPGTRPTRIHPEVHNLVGLLYELDRARPTARAP